MGYEYCTYCGDGIETQEECVWNNGNPFCQESCVEQFNGENKEDDTKKD